MKKMTHNYQVLFTLVLVFQLFTAQSLFAVTKTWTGNTNSDWATASNWNPNSVPTADDDVKIPNVTTDPIIGGSTDAVAKSVDIWNGGNLTLEVNAQLSIDEATTDFGLRNNNGGTVQNAGKIIVDANVSLPKYGVENHGVFDNQSTGEIHIDNTASDGFVNQSSNTFINSGKIIVGANSTIGRFGLYIYSDFDNKAGGEIHVDNTENVGIAVLWYGLVTFNNWGKIFIGAIGEVKSRGIISGSEHNFNNYAGAEIHIDRVEFGGIVQNPDGIFTNEGKIIIGANAPCGFTGVRNDGTFNNEATGEIYVDDLQSVPGSTQALLNWGHSGQAVFNNAGKIAVGATKTITGEGMDNRAQFNNLAGGELTIDRTTHSGIVTFIEDIAVSSQ